MMILGMRAFFLISLFSSLGIQARTLLEPGCSPMVNSNYGRTPKPPPPSPKPSVPQSLQTQEISSAPAVKSLDKVLLRMLTTYKRTTGMKLVQPSLATSYGRRTLSPPPPPKAAPPTHYGASTGVYESPPAPFLASS